MEDFVFHQSRLANAIRCPEKFAAAGEDERRRIAIYQSLFFNNVNGFLQTGFPVLYNVLSDNQWETLARHFFSFHQGRSPYFVDIAKEFIEFLSHNPSLPEALPDFVCELAHYEWIEQDVAIRKDIETSQTTPLYEGRLQFSPLATLVSYRYPVHLIGPDYCPDAPSDERHYYLVYRDNHDDVQFIHINMLTALLLNIFESEDNGVTATQASTKIKSALPDMSEEVLEQGATAMISEMIERQVLIAAD